MNKTCGPRHYGPTCEGACPTGKYRILKTCNGVCRCKEEAQCEVLTGKCGDAGCLSGYTGEICQDVLYEKPNSGPSSMTRTFIIVVLAAIVIILICGALFMYYLKKHNKGKKMREWEFEPLDLDFLHLYDRNAQAVPSQNQQSTSQSAASSKTKLQEECPITEKSKQSNRGKMKKKGGKKKKRDDRDDPMGLT